MQDLLIFHRTFMAFFWIAFFLVLLFIIIGFVQRAIRWVRNTASPRLSTEAVVAAKRTQFRGRRSSRLHSHSVSDHWVTFAFPSGDSLELLVDLSDYEALQEGDKGMLSLQGTKYLDFKRS